MEVILKMAGSWALLVAGFSMAAMMGIWIYKFYRMPTAKQLESVREWMLYAVTEAEKQLGSGTGQLKLRLVYDMFLGRYPSMERLVTFDMVSKLVDETLDSMKAMLRDNKAAKEYVYGTEKEAEANGNDDQ